MYVTWVFGDVWSDFFVWTTCHSLPVGMHQGIYLISLLEAKDHTSETLLHTYGY